MLISQLEERYPAKSNDSTKLLKKDVTMSQTTTKPRKTDCSSRSNSSCSSYTKAITAFGVLLIGLLSIVGFNAVQQGDQLSGTSIGKTAGSWKRLSSSLSSETSRSDHHVAFHLRPDDFIDQLADCLEFSPNCHIIYRHVGKTGGTGLQEFFWKLLVIRHGDSCCEQSMTRRFFQNSSDFCTQRFQSYEVTDGFDTMVKECDEQYYKKSSSSSSEARHRLIVLTTLREPAERYLSKVHHWCNKHLEQRSPEFQAACGRCNFVDDTDIWMGIAEDQGLREDRILVEQTRGSLYNYPHLWLDVSDMTTMMRRLESHFIEPHQHVKSVFDWYFGKRHNPESFEHCRFSLDSRLFKGLKESKVVYKDFLTGQLWQNRTLGER